MTLQQIKEKHKNISKNQKNQVWVNDQDLVMKKEEGWVYTAFEEGEFL